MGIEHAGTREGKELAPRPHLNLDFWKYWSGQTISHLGNSITIFALPLLVFNMTHSPIYLGLAEAAIFLPYLLFGLLIGAWSDRTNRKQLMVLMDIGRALVIMTIPLFALMGWLNVWWIFLVSFAHSTMNIAFEAGQFAAIPNLVNNRDLVTANGRIQASYSGAQVLGPLLAGILITTIPVSWLFTLDACTFLLSAISLASIRKSFNLTEEKRKSYILRDVVDGLRYVFRHPILRNISLMMALVNFVANMSFAQLVLFAKTRLQADDFQVSLLFTAGSLGIVLLALIAGPLRKRWSFSRVALGALMLDGLLILALAFTAWYWLAVLLWALAQGLSLIFNINTSSLRQTIVPNEMLGRVMTIASVMAWSAIPVGATLGGFAIAWTNNIVLIFALSGILITLIAFLFSFTALGHADTYIAQESKERKIET